MRRPANSFLAAAILVAVDPVKRIQDARNAKRWAEVNGMLNAMLTKQVDARALYDGETSAPIITGAAAQVIVSDDSIVVCNVPATAPACPSLPVGAALDIAGADKHCVANLSGIVPDYLAELPIDPLGAGTTPTAGNGYSGIVEDRPTSGYSSLPPAIRPNRRASAIATDRSGERSVSMQRPFSCGSHLPCPHECLGRNALPVTLSFEA